MKCFHEIWLLFSCSHSAGDVLMVQPSNLADVTQEFIAHLALEPEKKFFLEQNDPGESFLFPGCVECHYKLHWTLHFFNAVTSFFSS